HLLEHCLDLTGAGRRFHVVHDPGLDALGADQLQYLARGRAFRIVPNDHTHAGAPAGALTVRAPTNCAPSRVRRTAHIDTGTITSRDLGIDVAQHHHAAIE